VSLGSAFLAAGVEAIDLALFVEQRQLAGGVDRQIVQIGQRGAREGL